LQVQQAGFVLAVTCMLTPILLCVYVLVSAGCFGFWQPASKRQQVVITRCGCCLGSISCTAVHLQITWHHVIVQVNCGCAFLCRCRVVRCALGHRQTWHVSYDVCMHVLPASPVYAAVEDG
jgi:hypothetical protein